jgi:hypothetical protein
VFWDASGSIQRECLVSDAWYHQAACASKPEFLVVRQHGHETGRNRRSGPRSVIRRVALHSTRQRLRQVSVLGRVWLSCP